VIEMPKRISISLPDPYYEKLERWAELDDRTIAGLAGYIVQKAIDEVEKEGKVAPKELPPDKPGK
jgi:predicted DNA-binding protein